MHSRDFIYFFRKGNNNCARTLQHRIVLCYRSNEAIAIFFCACFLLCLSLCLPNELKKKKCDGKVDDVRLIGRSRRTCFLFANSKPNDRFGFVLVSSLVSSRFRFTFSFYTFHSYEHTVGYHDYDWQLSAALVWQLTFSWSVRCVCAFAKRMRTARLQATAAGNKHNSAMQRILNLNWHKQQKLLHRRRHSRQQIPGSFRFSFTFHSVCLSRKRSKNVLTNQITAWWLRSLNSIRWLYIFFFT